MDAYVLLQHRPADARERPCVLCRDHQRAVHDRSCSSAYAWMHPSRFALACCRLACRFDLLAHHGHSSPHSQRKFQLGPAEHLLVPSIFDTQVRPGVVHVLESVRPLLPSWTGPRLPRRAVHRMGPVGSGMQRKVLSPAHFSARLTHLVSVRVDDIRLNCPGAFAFERDAAPSLLALRSLPLPRTQPDCATPRRKPFQMLFFREMSTHGA